jgi:hypothetical protein
MVGRISETARVIQWACAAASAVTTDDIDAPYNTELQPRIAKARMAKSPVFYGGCLYSGNTWYKFSRARFSWIEWFFFTTLFN